MTAVVAGWPWLCVALGGALGSMARYGVSLGLAPASGMFPWATLMANVLGCLLIGLLYVVLSERSFGSPLLRPLLMVGFLGGFTTFSTFSLEVLALWQQTRFAVAATYVLASNLLGLLAVVLGYGLGQQLFKSIHP